MAEAISAVDWAYRAVSRRIAQMPARAHVKVPRGAPNIRGEDALLTMPAFVPGDDSRACGPALAVKIVTVFASNQTRNLPAIQGSVIVLDVQTGTSRALLDGASLTAIRTGAGSGVATRLLARQDARTAAILGAGPQSLTQLEAVCAVRSIDRVLWWNRTRERAERAAACVADLPWCPRDLSIVSTVAEAVSNADIICTATAATEALFSAEAIKPGTHINAVGAFTPQMCELPAELVAAAVVLIDCQMAAREEAGDLLQAIGHGMLDPDVFGAEIGLALDGRAAGRTSTDQVTLFKSVGVAAQDAVTASLAVANAERDGIGQLVDW